MQEENNRREHLINENMHVNINFIFLLKLFFGEKFIVFVSDVFDILLIIVYFNTSHTKNYDQILVRKSIVASMFMYLITLTIRVLKIINASQYFGQNLRLQEVEKKITFEKNNVFINVMFVISILFQCPSTVLLYYFVPFSKSTMCNIYGTFYCNMIRAYCVLSLLFMSIILIGLFSILCAVEAFVPKGICRDSLMFFRNNLIGLMYGNFINSCDLSRNF